MASTLLRAAALLTGLVAAPFCMALTLDGEAIQGNILFGQAEPGSEVRLDGRSLLVTPDGNFVFAFGRDDSGTVTLEVSSPAGETEIRELTIMPREYNIERVDGLPPATVTPPPEVQERIQEDNRQVASARARRDLRSDWVAGFIWPAQGRLSGFYGSQRVLNGEPRRPHYGVDVAAPVGTPVVAPAAGVVTLAHPDMYFSGGTIIIDHGLGLSSTFLHLSEVDVTAGMAGRTG